MPASSPQDQTPDWVTASRIWFRRDARSLPRTCPRCDRVFVHDTVEDHSHVECGKESEKICPSQRGRKKAALRHSQPTSNECAQEKAKYSKTSDERLSALHLGSVRHAVADGNHTTSTTLHPSISRFVQLPIHHLSCSLQHRSLSVLFCLLDSRALVSQTSTLSLDHESTVRGCCHDPHDTPTYLLIFDEKQGCRKRGN